METKKGFFVELAELLQRYQRLSETAHPAQNQAPSRVRKFLRWLTPNGGTILLILALILTQNVWARPLQSGTNNPGPSAYTINYQGNLADPQGVPLNGTYTISFTMLDAPTGNGVVWGPETHTGVSVSNGLFSVGLGSQYPIATTTWNGDVYLEIAVNGETLSPRELIRSVPIAGMALTVPDGALGSRHVSLSSGRQQATGTTNLTDAWMNIPNTSLSVNPETNQTYIVYVTADARIVAGGGKIFARLSVDGVAQPGEIRFTIDTETGRVTATQVYWVNLSPGGHTLVVQAKVEDDNLTTGTIESNTSITYIAVSQ